MEGTVAGAVEAAGRSGAPWSRQIPKVVVGRQLTGRIII
jgi:hypothetical protein